MRVRTLAAADVTGDVVAAVAVATVTGVTERDAGADTVEDDVLADTTGLTSFAYERQILTLSIQIQLHPVVLCK